MTPIKPVSHAIRSFFICEKFPSLLYLPPFSPDTLRSWPQVWSTCKVSQKCRRKCHRSIWEKRTVTKAKSLFVGKFEISSKKSSHWKMPRIFCHKNSMARGWADIQGGGYSFKLAIWVCTSVALKSTGFQSNLYCKTIIIFSPSFRKNIQHFHLISLLDLTLHIDPNDDHWKL